MKVQLGTMISEYSVRNKNDEDIHVYSVTNEQGFCTGYFNKDVSSKDRSIYKIVPRGYFAYNPSRINVGSIGWQNCEERVIVSPLYVVFGVNEKIDQRYLLYFLKSDIALTYIRAYATGSVRDNLKFSVLCKMQINLIPIDRQRQIAGILDSIDCLIGLYKEKVNMLDYLVKSKLYDDLEVAA
ncbi:MAG: restriction endonuclease subunit S [Lachnospiraceae bacterium]|nr:restriction endonuclease subunit S [Lachnospiraceae bacterium]